MSGSRTFCPRCGEAIEPGEGLRPPNERASRHAALCADCYFEGFELVSLPEELTVRVCATCGAVARGDHWEDVGAQDYTDVAIDAVGEAIQVHRAATDLEWSVEPTQRGPNELDLHCMVSAQVHDRPIVEERTVSARIARETCTRCGQIAGDSYAGTVQVRAAERRPTEAETDRAVEIAHEVVGEMQETGNRTAFVSEVIDRPEGLDIRVSTTGIGAKIASRFTDELGGHFESSERLITEDSDGERVYRVAYAVRLPRFRRGEIIDPRDEAGPVLVRSGATTVRGRRLATGEDVSLDEEAVARADRLGSIEDLVDTTVVAVEDEHAVQILDPETAAAVTIPRPADFPAEAKTVPAFKSRTGLYAIPSASLEAGESP